MNLVPKLNTLADDMAHAKPTDGEENWTESFLFWVYLDNTRHLYIHFHRYPPVSEVWRCIATILYEDGTVLGYQNFGRELSLSGPGFQQCHAICDKPYEAWQVHVDTVAQRTTCDTLRQEPLKSFDHTNLVPLKIDLEVTSDTPTYEPMSYTGARGSNAHWTHFTPCKAMGSVTVGTEKKSIEALAFRDHSVGPRDFGRMNTEGYGLVGVFPSGKSFMAMGSFDKDGSAGFSIGGVTKNGKLSYADKIVTPHFKLPAAGSELGELIIETAQGSSVVQMGFAGAGIAAEMTPPCFHSLGLSAGLNETALYYHEWRLEMEWEGERGVGSYQGSARP